MSILRLTSDNINVLCESIQKISLFEDDVKTSEIKKDNDKFSVDIDTKDKEGIAPYIDDSIDIDEVEKASPEEEKAQIEADFKNSIKDLLDVADSINAILQRSADYQNNYKEELSDDWVMSTNNNDICIPKRNTHLFRQNKNICLSHDNEIEIFNNVTELKAYLKKNEYPELTDEMMHELRESSNEEILNLLQESNEDMIVPAEEIKVGDVIYDPLKLNDPTTYYVYDISNGFIHAHNSDNYGSDINREIKGMFKKAAFNDVNECCGCGCGTTTASIAPAAIHTVPAKDKKKK